MVDNLTGAAYKRYRGISGEEEITPEEKAYREYLMKPIPESPIQRDVGLISQEYKRGGIMPALTAGFSGILNLAASSLGQRMIAGSTTEDRFTKGAWLESAMEKMKLEESARESARQAEQKRLGKLGEYVYKRPEEKRAVTREERAAEEFELEQEILQDRTDPASDVSKSYQILASEFSGKPIGDYANLSADDLEEQIGFLEKKYKADMMAKSKEEKAKEKDKKHTSNLKTLSSTLGEMKILFKDVPAGTGLLARPSGWLQSMMADVGLNPNLHTYENYRQVILGQIVKTIGGETGSRISDQDVKRMQKAIPSAGESKQERYKKWKLFGDIVNSISETYGAEPIFDDEGNILGMEGEGKKAKKGEVRRTTAGGRVAIFDSSTKKFLRYE